MSIIKFEGEKGSIQGHKPGLVNDRDKVFNGKVRYSLKRNLPENAPIDTLIFTTDTQEFYRGQGIRGGLSIFSSIEIYNSIVEFPVVGVDSKIYLDKGTASMFFYSQGRYREVGTGEGLDVEGFKDLRIGELSLLATEEKSSIVAALNEVFRKMNGLDVSEINDKIEQVRTEALDGIGRANVSINNLSFDVNAIKSTVDEVRVSNQEVSTNVNILAGTVQDSHQRVIDVELQAAQAKRTAEDVQRDFGSLRDSVANLNLGDLSKIGKLEDKIGQLDSLTTKEKATLVGSINELKSAIAQLESKEPINSEQIDFSKIELRVEQAELFGAILEGRIIEISDKLDGFPVAERIATRDFVRDEIRSIAIPSIEGLASESYVDNAIQSINVQVDLTNYAQKHEIDAIQDSIQILTSTVNNIAVGGEVDLTGYLKVGDVYTKSEVENFVTQKVSEIIIPDVSDFVSKSYVDTAINSIVFPAAPDLSNFITREELSTAISSVQPGNVDLTGYAKAEDVYSKEETEGLLSNLTTEVAITYATKTEVQSALSNIPEQVDISGLATRSELNTLSSAVGVNSQKIQEINATISQLVVITRQEKDKYDAYENTLNNLLSEVIPALVSRIERLEGFHDGETDPVGPDVPVNPDPPTDPEDEKPKDPSSGREIEWEYEFIMGPGEVDYELGKHEPNGLFPYTIPSVEEVYGNDSLRLYWLGYDETRRPDPILVESIGVNEPGSSREVPHNSYYYDSNKLFFTNGDLSYNAYKLVMLK